MKRFGHAHNLIRAFVTGACLISASAYAAPKEVSFNGPAARVEAYDFAEIGLHVASPDAPNPFTDVSVEGVFEKTDGSRQWKVEGFCDSADGSEFRIRFMPAEAGDYKYRVTYRQGKFEKTSSGTFHAYDGHLWGPIRVDPKYPWHFIWEGTRKHYFYNGTTAYWLAGWKDDRIINASIDRLHRLKVNRLRVTLAGRECYSLYGEPVMVIDDSFSNRPSPWPAVDAHDCDHPGFDYSRFNVAYWRHWEDMLRFARKDNVIISVVLDMNDSGVHPAAGSEDERRFIRYAVDRFGAFSNITWDLGDDLNGYRTDQWTHDTGTLLEQWDPYKHLASSHPRDNPAAHQDRSSAWFGFTSYQDWSRGEAQHELMLESRKLQEKAGRIIPQTNEEYGYEDHRPFFSVPGTDTADALRRTAWAIVMAGGYGDTGETAKRGTNIWPNTGGGWINGRGDDTMTMLLGYGHMVDFFTGFDWWKTNPHDELVNEGNWCVAELGKIYAVYLPNPWPGKGKATIQLPAGHYSAEWFSALSGERIPLPDVDVPVGGSSWTSPEAPDTYDWALLLLNQNH